LKPPKIFRLCLVGICLLPQAVCTLRLVAGESAFYTPADPNYSLSDSVRDSLKFTVDHTLKTDSKGHLVSISSFVDPDAQVMGWHDFGNLEGPGWAANAVGGAWEIYTSAKLLQKPEWGSNALAIVDHVMDCGFLEEETGFIRGYRETTTGKFCLNYKHNSDWLCPGSMAKIGYQLLVFSDCLPGTRRAARMRTAAVQCARWIELNVEPVRNGWYPRRVTPAGRVYRKSPDGGNDPFWQTSADSLFILQLQAGLMRRGLADYSEQLRSKCRVFMNAGGIFGSINHDTYDPHENVAYSVAFRTFMLAAKVLHDGQVRDFAFRKCLAGLDQFKMTEDRNNVATKGLLFMEKSWDTAYLWENAEAAQAFFEAALYLREREPARSQQYELDGLVILRAIARHHYGKLGFLTEGVDWNDHVGQQHHIQQAKYAAIRYTEPFLNNQHIAEPTMFYLRHLAKRMSLDNQQVWVDREGNILLRISNPGGSGT
jgi:hypothetical protein